MLEALLLIHLYLIQGRGSVRIGSDGLGLYGFGIQSKYLELVISGNTWYRRWPWAWSMRRSVRIGDVGLYGSDLYGLVVKLEYLELGISGNTWY